MSQYLGDKLISGVTTGVVSNAHFLFEHVWSDHLIGDMCFLRADTFSWQSGTTYKSAYDHLVADITGISSETETIGSYTVTFYRAADGHKICLADMESTVLNIYNETGIAWYYIVDTTNTQFKLPRTKFGFEGLRGNVGDMIPQDVLLPNITGEITIVDRAVGRASTGAFYTTNTSSRWANWSEAGGGGALNHILDASRSSSVYSGNGTNTNIQQKATQMYLYFYVGDYTQSAIEQTAGLNTELFNGKVDIPTGGSQSSVGLLVESYVNGTSWYRVYSDGWCEQGGFCTDSTSYTVTFLKPFINTNYNPTVTFNYSHSGNIMNMGCDTLTTTTMRININDGNQGTSRPVFWQACGYIS